MRTPLTVFAIGAGGCVAMGMMMQHLLRVSQERNVSPALQEINRVFGPRLEGEATLRYANRPEGAVAQLTLQPLVVGGGRDLAREVGQFMWRAADRPLAGVEIVCRDLMGGTDERYTIDRPAQLMVSQRPAKAQKVVPTAPSGTAPKPAQQAPPSSASPVKPDVPTATRPSPPTSSVPPR